MATIRDLLSERVEALRDLTERIQQELEGDADLEKLSSMADELSAAGDSFASTITKAQEALTGGEESGEEGDEEQEGGG
jgi:hypothetical protein